MNSIKDATREWQLEIGGKTMPLGRELSVGRDPASDVMIDDDQVSWQHAQIAPGPRGPVVRDLGSRNGTLLNGQPLTSAPALVTAEASLQFGRARAWLTLRAISPDSGTPFRRIPLGDHVVTIGRSPDNDVALQDLNVSWHHAEIEPGEPPTIIDRGSRNGTRLNQAPLEGRGSLSSGVQAGIGRFNLWSDSRELVVHDSRAALSLVAQQVAVHRAGKTILHPTDLRVASGEFVALIGPSGAGKSTLLKCLAGVSSASAGRVLVGQEPLSLRLTDLGYVAQADTVHGQLTVKETLDYAARLRLPSDMRAQERGDAVSKLLGELGLQKEADKRVGDISGGQRKRVACGVELIGNPTMLLLDEPTSGLDPALERQLMTMLRNLASSGRGVVVVTHATSSLAMCDTLAVMAPGGHLLYAGGPRATLERFGVGAFDQIYDEIKQPDKPAAAPISRTIGGHPRHRPPLLSGQSLLKHAVALTARYVRTLVRDWRTLAIQVGQAPAMGLLIALLYPAHVLARPDVQPGRSAQFVFLLVTVALWLGLFDSCREIVKERAIVVRELSIGVRLDAYLISKAAPLLALTTLQVCLMFGAAAAIQPIYAHAATYLELGGILVLTSWTGIGFGLVVSAMARSVDQATSLIPLLLIPQLLFGAALEPYQSMQGPVKVISDLMASRWAFAVTGHLIDMNGRLAEAPPGSVNAFGTSFFALKSGIAAAILAGLSAAALLITALLLYRRAQRDQI
jgi:ABC-type multidrug transport system ATPase subunit/pSer/pThr/pTyr-binding forkhead associated (FHA) protein